LPALVLVALGCDGVIGDLPPGDDPGVVSPALCAESTPDAPATATRLLDRTQYTNALRSLLGDETLAPVLDEKMGELVTTLGAEQLYAEVERVVSTSDLGNCTDDACASAYLRELATRAFRRPLREDEQTLLNDLYQRERNHEEHPTDVRGATETVVQVILQAPQTLYLHEEGVEDVGQVRRLGGYEIASRLALLLWNGIPDDTLRNAAADGRLEDADGVRREAERMLDDPRSRAMVRDFFERWLGLNGSENRSSLEEASKDETLFPEADADLRRAMRDELGRFVERAIFEGDGSLETLFLSRDAYVDDALAALYGVDAPAGGGWVELPEGQRAGILTRAGFLSVYAGAKVRSPIRRGVFILQNVLCQPLGEPPPNANDVDVEGGNTEDGVRSIRDDVTARTRGGECAACHNSINDIGFSFGHYDAIGQFQTEEHHAVDEETITFPIDASGRVASGSDIDGEVANALELSARLAQSEQVANCVATRFYEYAMGRHAGEGDACSVESVRSEFRRSGRFVDLIVAVARSDAFRHVRVAEEE
ncbi:MAG: DUF1592 domain-containing protein, partial [Myxococcota bacterium]